MHVYLDGTVLVSHGGTEMGQGLHTKVCQVVANEFGIDVEKVRSAPLSPAVEFGTNEGVFPHAILPFVFDANDRRLPLALRFCSRVGFSD